MPASASVIRCPIHGSIRLNDRELALIDSPFFQRLRSISQLGFTSYVFPGATHTRFSHSLGVLHLAGRIYEQIIDGQQESLSQCYHQEQLAYFGQILRFAALLHDVGHPPFSHAAESILPPLSALDVPAAIVTPENRQSTHEDFSRTIIYHLAENEGLLTREEATDIIGILSKHHSPSERMNSKAGYPLIYPLLRQLISGEIDSDRMDYLLRDSYFAGVPYGRFDLDRLISSLTCCKDENLNQYLLAIDGEGVPAYEIFLLARIHMFYQIYFHKSLGAYRHYLAKAFEENEIAVTIDGSLDNFLLNTENRWIEEFQANQDKKWSGRIHHRIPAKSLIRVLDGETEKRAKLENIHSILRDNAIEVFVSRSSNQFSTQIKNRNIDQNTVLVIDEEFGKGTVTPLSEKSSLLEPVEKQIEIIQLYVLRENYDQAIQLLQNHLF